MIKENSTNKSVEKARKLMKNKIQMLENISGPKYQDEKYNRNPEWINNMKTCMELRATHKNVPSRKHQAMIALPNG